MNARTKKMLQFATLAAMAVAMTAMAASPARADHDSFEYTGPRYGFHGEVLLIQSLEQMEFAYTSFPSRRYAARALRSVHYARAEVCSYRARFYLAGAMDHLRWHLSRPNRYDLDEAARLVTKALAAERELHAHPVRIDPFPRHRGAWGFNRGGLYIGGRQGGLFIRF